MYVFHTTNTVLLLTYISKSPNSLALGVRLPNLHAIEFHTRDL